jgi:prolyl oligopeptidase
MFNTRRLVLFLLIGTANLSASQSSPPQAPVRPVTETLHGVTLTDPYRWMEDGGEELTDWMKAQDAYTRRVLERIPGRQELLAELRALNTDGTTVAHVRRSGNRYVYLKRNAGEQVAKLYVREEPAGDERALFDPTGLSEGSNQFTIGEFALSPDGRYVAFAAAPSGTGVGTARVIEIGTGRVLTDTISGVLGIDSWRPDSRAFTYMRQRDRAPGSAPVHPYVCATTLLHIIGTPAADDRPLIGCGVSPRVPINEMQFGSVGFSAASPHALAWVSLNPAATQLVVYTAPVDALDGPNTPWRRLAGPEDQVAEVVLRGDAAYLLTSRNAPRRQVVRTSVLDPNPAHGTVVVPASEAVIAPAFEPNAIFSPALYVAKDALYVRMRDAAVSRVVRVPFDGGSRTDVALPFSGRVYDASADPGREGLSFALQAWMRAPRLYVFDPKRGDVTPVPLMEVHPAERAELDAVQVKVRSGDGTLVPLTIIAASNLKKDQSHPTRVFGYGAYGLVPEPTFRPSLIPWLERGGVDAICHARGGGEYGDEWHRAGQKANKRNTIADFIACAEHLVAERYTTRARLAGFGASAGGLTIGGAITSRPDLFAVALPSVPLIDLLRFEFSGVGPPNIPEFGTVKDPVLFKEMLAVSPYHRIENGTRYPAVLVSTAINDQAVPTWQPAKLVARLQAATASGKPVLLRVDWGSGHFGGTTTSDQETLAADIYSFMLWQMGIEGFQPAPESR